VFNRPPPHTGIDWVAFIAVLIARATLQAVSSANVACTSCADAEGLSDGEPIRSNQLKLKYSRPVLFGGALVK
jgi:hypothetical protein